MLEAFDELDDAERVLLGADVLRRGERGQEHEGEQCETHYTRSLMKDEEKRNLKVVHAPSKPAACSFCGKRKDEARALIAGDSAFICDECVAKVQKALKRP